MAAALVGALLAGCGGGKPALTARQTMLRIPTPAGRKRLIAFLDRIKNQWEDECEA